MPSDIVAVPTGPLADLLNAAEGGGPDLPPADPILHAAMTRGIGGDGVGDDGSPPGIHLSGGTGGIRDLGEEREMAKRRMRAMLGPPPQPIRYPEPPQPYNPYAAVAPPTYPVPMYPPPVHGGGVGIQMIDLSRRAIITTHGNIPINDEVAAKMVSLAVGSVKTYFAEAMKSTMEAYGMGGGTKRGKRKQTKRKRVPKVQTG